MVKVRIIHKIYVISYQRYFHPMIRLFANNNKPSSLLRSDDGITNNLAESYFSRFRRMQYGQTHKFGNQYLVNYANEAAYREDTRRLPNGEIFMDIITKCAITRTNRDWCGYWQGNKRKEERLAA